MGKIVKYHLNIIQLSLAGFCYIYCLLKCFYLVYTASLDKEEVLSFDLHASWWFGRKMDDSDYEWRYFSDFFTTNLHWYLMHALIGVIMNSTFTTGRLYVNILYSILAVGSLFGFKHLAFIISNSCLIYLTVIITKRKLFVWIISLVILALLNVRAAEPLIMSVCENDSGFKYRSLVYVMTISSMRLVSVGTELIDQYHTTGEIDSFYKIVSYNVYFPSYFGPFITYQQFIKSMCVSLEPVSWTCIKYFLKQSTLLIVWWMVMEISLHYFYCTALLQEEYFLLGTSNWSIFAISIIQVALFNIKYQVIYGIPILFSQLDGINMPEKPAFMLILFRISHIWRHFDVGLYNFVFKYVYIPLGGSRYDLSRQVLTLFTCFLFVGFWHGSELHIIIWAIVNYLTILMDKFHNEFIKSQRYKSLQMRIGVEKAHYIQTLLLIPVGLIALWSIFLFMGGKNSGFIIAKKLVKNSSIETKLYILVLTFIYLILAQSVHNGDLTRSFNKLLFYTGYKTPHTEHSQTNGKLKKLS